MSKKNVEFLNEFSGRLLIFFLLLKTGSGAVLWANIVCPEGPNSVRSSVTGHVCGSHSPTKASFHLVLTSDWMHYSFSI